VGGVSLGACEESGVSWVGGAERVMSWVGEEGKMVVWMPLGDGEDDSRTYFYLEEVLWRAVDFLKGLMPRIGDGLHCGRLV